MDVSVLRLVLSLELRANMAYPLSTGLKNRFDVCAIYIKKQSLFKEIQQSSQESYYKMYQVWKRHAFLSFPSLKFSNISVSLGSHCYVLIKHLLLYTITTIWFCVSVQRGTKLSCVRNESSLFQVLLNQCYMHKSPAELPQSILSLSMSGFASSFLWGSERC